MHPAKRQTGLKPNKIIKIGGRSQTQRLGKRDEIDLFEIYELELTNFPV